MLIRLDVAVDIERRVNRDTTSSGRGLVCVAVVFAATSAVVSRINECESQLSACTSSSCCCCGCCSNVVGGSDGLGAKCKCKWTTY